MRSSPLSATAVVALLIVAGCTGLPGAGGNGSSPDVSPADFPNASAIDQSVFDTHAAALGNTSFTLTLENVRKDRVFLDVEENFTYMNGTRRYRVEPGASQYLAHKRGYFTGGGNVTYYSNGTTTYTMWRNEDGSTVKELPRYPVFNESNEYYLWDGWFANASGSELAFASMNATFEREGVETFRGVGVMRYEATGVEALPDWMGGENASSFYESFSATLLLDEDGIIRYYEYDFVYSEAAHRRLSRSYTLSDVGSTDVEKPKLLVEAASNATAGT